MTHCADDGAPMRVVRVNEQGLALCEDACGTRYTVEIALVDAQPGTRPRPPAPTCGWSTRRLADEPVVVLSGGVFQNALLRARTRERASSRVLL